VGVEDEELECVDWGAGGEVGECEEEECEGEADEVGEDEHVKRAVGVWN
jgi:hypothetical protein